MKDIYSDQSEQGATLADAFPRRHVEVFRPPLPIEPIYPKDRLKPGRKTRRDAPAASGEIGKSMFFNRKRLKIDDDPFLRRLSRLG